LSTETDAALEKYGRIVQQNWNTVEVEGLQWQMTKKDLELLKLRRALKANEEQLITIAAVFIIL
jgi:hypothetical protein